MARSTNSSKKNITTTKKTDVKKDAVVSKESVTGSDKGVTKVNEIEKEAEKKDLKTPEKAAVKETAPKKTTVKKTVESKAEIEKKDVAKKEEQPKETEKKTSETKAEVKEQTKAAPKKRGRKLGSKNKQKEQLTPEVYVQYHGEEAAQNAIIEKIKEQYVSEGHRIGNIKSLKLYLKPEDRAAYYVINDRYAGKVDLFNA